MPKVGMLKDIGASSVEDSVNNFPNHVKKLIDKGIIKPWGDRAGGMSFRIYYTKGNEIHMAEYKNAPCHARLYLPTENFAYGDNATPIKGAVLLVQTSFDPERGEWSKDYASKFVGKGSPFERTLYNSRSDIDVLEYGFLHRTDLDSREVVASCVGARAYWEHAWLANVPKLEEAGIPWYYSVLMASCLCNHLKSINTRGDGHNIYANMGTAPSIQWILSKGRLGNVSYMRPHSTYAMTMVYPTGIASYVMHGAFGSELRYTGENKTGSFKNFLQSRMKTRDSGWDSKEYYFESSNDCIKACKEFYTRVLKRLENDINGA